jgi:hypothetical protein
MPNLLKPTNHRMVMATVNVPRPTTAMRIQVPKSFR